MAKFCPECGADVEGLKFCPECGFKLTELQTNANCDEPANNPINENENNEEIITKFETELIVDLGRKKLVGDLSIGQAKNLYTLTTERLIVEKQGMIKGEREELDLYRFRDVSVKQSVSDKLRGVGDIIIYSTDSSDPTLEMKSVKNPSEIAEQIRKAAKNRKSEMGVVYRQDL